MQPAPGSSARRAGALQQARRAFALARLELDDETVVTARTPGYAAPRPWDQVGLMVEGEIHSFEQRAPD